MSVGEVMPSPSHNLLGYTVDTVGYETYELKAPCPPPLPTASPPPFTGLEAAACTAGSREAAVGGGAALQWWRQRPAILAPIVPAAVPIAVP